MTANKLKHSAPTARASSREQTCSRSIAASPSIVGVLLFIFLLTSSSFAQSPNLPSNTTLVLLDGSTLQTKSLTIAAGKLSGAGLPAGLALDDLRQIELPAAPPSQSEPAAAIVELPASGRVFAKSVTIENEQVRIEWSADKPLTLSLDLLRALRLEPRAASSQFEQALAKPSAESDRVFVKDEAGQLSSIAGLIDSLDAEVLTIEIAGQRQRLPRARLYGAVIAQPVAANAAPYCLVTFRDGSALGGQEFLLAGSTATLRLGAGNVAEFNWSEVSGVLIRSHRVAFLSDLKPLAEEQEPLVTLPFPAQRDKSVAGRPLMLAGKVYKKGWGVHARSSLTFATDGKWDVLAATIGLDASADGQGDCVFVVLADQQPLFSRRMRGHDPPAKIQLPVTGRQRVTLCVEPGAGLDLADHANWCDARFIRAAH